MSNLIAHELLMFKMQYMIRKLTCEDFLSEDVVSLARFFLGKYLVCVSKEGCVGAWITETEAYGGIEDLASHAAGGRRTNRTKTMYERGGIAYVYLCYGIHRMLNFVTGPEGLPYAVLIRAVKIEEGKSLAARRRKTTDPVRLGSGPGCVTQALGIHLKDNGLKLTGNRLWIEDHGIKISQSEIEQAPRVGVDYAGEIWAKKPWRMIWKNMA